LIRYDLLENIDSEQHQEVIKAFHKHYEETGVALGRKRLSEMCDIPPGVCRTALKIGRKMGIITQEKSVNQQGTPHHTIATQKVQKETYSENGNDAQLEMDVSENPRTLEDIIRVCKIDTDVWHVDRWLANKWEMGYKDANSQAQSKPLFQVKVWLIRKEAIVVNTQLPELRPVHFSTSTIPTKKKRHTNGLQSALVVPDPHIGYLRDGQTGEMDPFHDRRVIDITFQLAQKIRPDIIIILGDGMDLPDWSDKFTQTPSFYHTFQPTLWELGWTLAQYRSLCAGSQIVFIPGNHDDRIKKSILKYMMQIYQIKPANTPDPLPALSLENLLGLRSIHVDIMEDYPKGKFWLNREMSFEHGTDVGAKSGASVTKTLDRSAHSRGYGHCFDEKTEILTPEGWVKHDRLSEYSKVMTLNRSTNKLQWNKVNAVYKYDHFKELIKIKGHRGVDLMVTPGHGLWTGLTYAANKSRGKKIVWKESTAEEIFGKQKRIFQVAAEHSDSPGIPLTLPQIRVIAWIMSEGCLEFDENRKIIRNIRVAQSQDGSGRFEAMIRDFTEAGLEFSIKKRYNAGETEHGIFRNFNAYRLGIRKARSFWEHTLCHYMDFNKTPTLAMCDMSLEQMNTFIDAYVMGDGHRIDDHKFQLSTKRKTHIDWLQQLCIRTGRRCKSSQNKNTGLYYLAVNDRNMVELPASSWTKESYEGIVWCVNVDNGTLLVRRNGNPCITLNTHRLETAHRTQHVYDGAMTYSAYSFGTCARLDGPIPAGNVDLNWQNGCGVVWFDDDRHFADVLHIKNGETVYQGELIRGDCYKDRLNREIDWEY